MGRGRTPVTADLLRAEVYGSFYFCHLDLLDNDAAKGQKQSCPLSGPGATRMMEAGNTISRAQSSPRWLGLQPTSLVVKVTFGWGVGKNECPSL